jgi:signal peptidase I
MRNPRGFFAELAEVAALAVGLYLVITFAVQTVHVLGLSMYPTVEDQDYLLAVKLPYRFHQPERGDIVIMRNPFNPSQDFIKRIIGTPGDRVLVEGCRVYINDRLLAEPYLAGRRAWRSCAPPWPQSGRERPLGSNEYFVMGDNRDLSTDSRTFGPIRRGQIEAQAWFRVFPLGHIGTFTGPRPYLTSQRLPAAA